MYGPSLPPWFGQSAQSEHGSDLNQGLDHQSKQSEQPNRCVRLEPKSTQTKGNIRFGQNTYLSLHLQRRISPLFMSKGLLSPKGPLLSKTKQHDPDPVFYREVDMSDLPSQYAEEIETFRHILDLPGPRETILGLLLLFLAWMM